MVANLDVSKTLDPLPLPNTLPLPEFNSKFGGLWTDLSNAPDLLDGKFELGLINEYEAQKLKFFIENGYVILEKAISEELVDQLNNDIDRIWNEELKGFFLERIGPVKAEQKNKRNKLLDIYANLEAARAVNLNPNIGRFLSLIFERPALAFQSLSFLYGSQQPVHQDTAYVRVSSPLEFVASWIALEDIKENTGELEYYVGSHKLPDYPFKANKLGRKTWFPPNKSKWQDYGNNEPDYLEWLHTESKKLGFKKSKFLANKGDVLIWAADFAHGGSKIEGGGKKSRLSFVTHYCPLNCNPFYWYHSKHSPKIKHNKYAYYTSKYRTEGKKNN